jgi:atypical dual specificity phosphatase
MSVSAKIQSIRDTIGVVGPAIDLLAVDALKTVQDSLHLVPATPPYTISLVTEQELRGVSQSHLARLPTEIDTKTIFSAGVGGHPDAGVYFVVIIWAAGQQLRKLLKLPPRHFYIPLSDRDSDDVDKGIDSLLPGQFPEPPIPDFLDHLTFTLHLFGRYEHEQPFCVDLIKALPESHRGFLRLADAARCAGQHKISMLSYASAFQRTDEPKVRDYCIKQLVTCSKFTEWGGLFLESELSQLPAPVMTMMLDPWPEELRLVIGDLGVVPSLCLDPRDRLFVPSPGSTVPERKLPRNFRWLVPFCIAVMSTPRLDLTTFPLQMSMYRDENDVATLASPHIGIRHVLTLTEEEPLNDSWFKVHPIKNTFLPIPNFHAPSIEQMDIILTLTQDDANLPLLIHCGGGKGRAGTVAACYLVAYGFRRPCKDQIHPEMSSGEAITALRSIRPGSIETPQQEQFVSKWCKAIWSRGSVLPDIPTEPPPCAMEIEGILDEKSDLFVLVGLPGAGKTWFSDALHARNPKAWRRISQDDSGSRDQCEREIGRVGGRVFLDRCNRLEQSETMAQPSVHLDEGTRVRLV